jgi:hypothetical protein
VRFEGNWEDKVKYDGCDAGHTLLVVGARLTGRTDGIGGLALLVQNTWPYKTFVTIGIDLLRPMGVKRLLAVQSGLEFGTGPYDITPDALMVQSGASPSKSPVDGIPNELIWDLNTKPTWGLAKEKFTVPTWGLAKKKFTVPTYWELIVPTIAKEKFTVPTYWELIVPKENAN